MKVIIQGGSPVASYVLQNETVTRTVYWRVNDEHAALLMERNKVHTNYRMIPYQHNQYTHVWIADRSENIQYIEVGSLDELQAIMKHTDYQWLSSSVNWLNEDGTPCTHDLVLRDSDPIWD